MINILRLIFLLGKDMEIKHKIQSKPAEKSVQACFYYNLLLFVLKPSCSLSVAIHLYADPTSLE